MKIGTLRRKIKEGQTVTLQFPTGTMTGTWSIQDRRSTVEIKDQVWNGQTIGRSAVFPNDTEILSFTQS